MRTIVDIPKEDIAMLDSIARREKISRAEVIRRMVAKEKESENARKQKAITGMITLRKNNPHMFDGLDGLEWQRKVRGEEGEIEAIGTPSYALADRPAPPYTPKDQKQ